MIIFNKECIAAYVTAKMKIPSFRCFLSTKIIQVLVHLEYYVLCLFNAIFDIYLNSITFIQVSNTILVNTVQRCFS